MVLSYFASDTEAVHDAHGVGLIDRTSGISRNKSVAPQVLRPQPGHSVPIIVLSAIGTLGGLGVGGGLFVTGYPGAGVVMVITGVAIGASCFGYFRNARVWFDEEVVGKTNLLGIETTCRRVDLSRLETRFSPQPTLNFIRKDGSRAFHINTRLWTDAQVQLIRQAVEP